MFSTGAINDAFFWIHRAILEIASFMFVFPTPHICFLLGLLFQNLSSMVLNSFGIFLPFLHCLNLFLHFLQLFLIQGRQSNAIQTIQELMAGASPNDLKAEMMKRGREKMLRQRSISKRKARMIQEVSNTDSLEMSHTN